MTSTLVPAEAFPPGEYLRDELEERGWSVSEFAEILGRPVQVVSEILNGHKQIIPETALALAEALGTSAELWTNLQSAFNLHEAKSNRPTITDVTKRSQLRSMVPVAELRQRGWLPDSSDVDVLATAVLDLLGISELNEVPNFSVAARRTDTETPFTPQQVAWLSQLRRIASERDAVPFDVNVVRKFAGELIHRLHDPIELGELENWLGDIGVILVTLLPLKSSKLDGAVIMLGSGNPVIGLTSRGDRMDSYVFTLFHELAHICLGHLDVFPVRTDEDIDNYIDVDSTEIEANELAASWILPEDISLPEGRPSMGVILQLAQRYRVHTCFVIGRIQRENQDWGFLRRSIPRVRPYVTVKK